MIERAGYPGIAADLDLEQIASILPTVKKQAREMQAEGERLTGHPGLPLEFTPNSPPNSLSMLVEGPKALDRPTHRNRHRSLGCTRINMARISWPIADAIGMPSPH